MGREMVGNIDITTLRRQEKVSVARPSGAADMQLCKAHDGLFRIIAIHASLWGLWRWRYAAIWHTRTYDAVIATAVDNADAGVDIV